MQPVKWRIDRETRVRIDIDEEGQDGDEIHIAQDVDGQTQVISLSPLGASPASMVCALIAAIEACGWDMPDLSAQGYVLKEPTT